MIFRIGQPNGCQGGNFLVATAKSEDGFRKAQQLTEEAAETPHRKETASGGIILKEGTETGTQAWEDAHETNQRS